MGTKNRPIKPVIVDLPPVKPRPAEPAPSIGQRRAEAEFREKATTPPVRLREQTWYR